MESAGATLALGEWKPWRAGATVFVTSVFGAVRAYPSCRRAGVAISGFESLRALGFPRLPYFLHALRSLRDVLFVELFHFSISGLQSGVNSSASLVSMW